MRTQIRLYIARFVGVGLHSDGISMALKSEPRTWLICSLCCVVLLVRSIWDFRTLTMLPHRQAVADRLQILFPSACTVALWADLARQTTQL
mmetsp:Transcript_162503/g.516235  ORF Transcript_162503/g.516235 Transcript_162503/m.516235 type:complete len:91 (+) Transcript_162503:978-1250(+)